MWVKKGIGMGNIMADIVDEIEIKPNRIKLVLKWVVAVSGSLIATAFLLGQLKVKHINRLDRIQTDLVEIKVKQTTGFNEVNTRIDKVYDDGILMFNEFQANNDKKLGLIIDYGGTNGDLLKRLLEINTLNLEPQIEKAKNGNVAPLVQDYMGEVNFIEVETSDTIFGLSGATIKYINTIDRNRYEVGAITESQQYPGRFDVSYRKKR
jgi:hypothetical protein